MGCDIYAYIEYRKPGKHWYPFGGRHRLNRVYQLFGKIAGIRDFGPPVCPVRGMPSDASYEAEEDNTLYVTDETQNERYVKQDKAEEWVAKGISQWTNHQKSWVTHPDWHTHTWLNRHEWQSAIDGTPSEYCPLDDYEAVTAVLKHFEDRGYEARVICWFDN